jgi:glucose/arabinose dehydrogenase
MGSKMSSEICAFQNAVLEPGFCAYELPIAVSKPRSVLTTGTSDLLALERGTSSIVFLFDSDDDGIPESRRTVANARGLNHGLALSDGYIYASSDTTVYRWSYEDFSSSSVGGAEMVIENINADGMGGAPQGHTTRTLAFDEMGRLYVSVGSGGNVDANSYRARIRRFDLSADSLPLDFQEGEVFADGLRNEVGLAFDKHGVLWGVDNGPDRLSRSDMGGDIHNDNPVRVRVFFL